MALRPDLAVVDRGLAVGEELAIFDELDLLHREVRRRLGRLGAGGRGEPEREAQDEEGSGPRSTPRAICTRGP